MVARWNRTVRENPLSDVDVVAAMRSVRSTPKSGKGKKKLGTAHKLAATRSVSSRTTKSKLSTSKSTKSAASAKHSDAVKSKKQVQTPSRADPIPAMGKKTDPKEWDPTMRPPTPRNPTMRHPFPRKFDSQPNGPKFVKPDLRISTSYASEAEEPANLLSPSTLLSFLSFSNTIDPTAPGVEEPTHNGRTGSSAESDYESEGPDFSQYTFLTEDGTEYKMDEVTFAMFLGDAKGYIVDKSGKMIPTGPEMSEFLRKTKEKAQDFVPESVKSNINDTAQVLDPRDISRGELLASAKEIGTVTKDVVVDETVGCAAWAFAEIFATLQNFTEKEHIKPEADDLPVIESMLGEGHSPADEQLRAEKFTATVTGVSISNPSETVSNVPQVSKQERSANYSASVPEKIFEHVSVEASIKQRKTSSDDQSQGYLSSPSTGISTMADEGNADMKDCLRQIKELNTEVEILLARGDPADVDLAEVLKHRSKVLCKNMAAASSRAARKTGLTRAAIITSNVVGQASSSVTKSSKKGLGTALLSTSKAMGSLGEKLAKSKQDDVTHTTGENSILSSRS